MAEEKVRSLETQAVTAQGSWKGVLQRRSEKRELPVAAVFSFIGAKPCTDWLPDEIETDVKGFVCTDSQIARSARWNLSRQPFLLETSRAGDVRAASVKRVASAVGEGSMTVQFVHEHLKEVWVVWKLAHEKAGASTCPCRKTRQSLNRVMPRAWARQNLPLSGVISTRGEKP